MDSQLFRRYIKKYASKKNLKKAEAIAADAQDYTPVPSVKDEVVYKVQEQDTGEAFVVGLSLKTPKAPAEITEKDLLFSCNCNMRSSKPCVHIAEVCMHTDAKASIELVTGAKNFNPRDTMFADHIPFTEKEIEFFPKDMQKAIMDMISRDAVKVIRGKNGKFRAVVEEAGKKHKVTFRKDKNSMIVHTSCTCNDKEHFMCIHKAAAWYTLKFIHGDYALEETHNWNKEKDSLLESFDNSVHNSFTFEFYLGDIIMAEYDEDEEEEEISIGQMRKTRTFYRMKLAFLKTKNKKAAGEVSQLAAMGKEALSGSQNYNMQDIVLKAYEIVNILKEQLLALPNTDIPGYVNDAYNTLSALEDNWPNPDHANGEQENKFLINSLEFLGQLLPHSRDTIKFSAQMVDMLDFIIDMYDEMDFEDSDDVGSMNNPSEEMYIPENKMARLERSFTEGINWFRDLNYDTAPVEVEEEFDDIDEDFGFEQNMEQIGFIFRIDPQPKKLDVLNLAPVYGTIKKNRYAHRKPIKTLDIKSPEISWINKEAKRKIETLPDYKKLDDHLNRLLKRIPDDEQWFAIDMNNNLREALRTFSNTYLQYLNNLLHHLRDEYLYYSSLRPKRNPYTTFNKFEVLNPRIIRYLTSTLRISSENDRIIARLTIYANGEPFNDAFTQAFYPVWLDILGGEIFLWKNHHHFMVAGYFGFKQDKDLVLSPEQWAQVKEEVLLNMQKHVPVHIDEVLQPAIQYPKPQCRIKLSETGGFMLLTPVFIYHGQEIPFNHPEDTLTVLEDGNPVFIQRDTETEYGFRTFIADLHPKFSMTSQQDYYFLRAEEVMKRMWFLDFYNKCKENDIEITGMDKLKSLKFNLNRPFTQYTIRSKTDWFNIDMSVQFGKQVADLNDIHKAVMKDSHYVKLKDNSYGIFPNWWLEKWGELVKFGRIENGTLQISKLHFQFIDKLFHEIDQEEVEQEIKEKKALLQSFEKIEPVAKPEGMKAELRNYQQTGLSWLAFLVSFKWGGILADDMGLGKTIQMLALFQRLKEEKHQESPVFLVVAPTTLLFNWENEISKFLPEMKYLLHWGTKRDTSTANWQEQDIILTSYGTLTQDIGWIKEFSFTVAVLDESQSIKNPASMRFKTVSLLNADYRFALTGTPIENNIMELYAQIQFVNPGFLGTQHFFKHAYAIPIDKNKDKEKQEALKNIVKPFILRRTKERVEKELPPKSEIPLFCEMEPEQREVYESFKNHYKKRLFEKIKDEGLNKSKMHVLEVLLKLRQISDSPAILNREKPFPNHSAKINELIRNIREKTGKHKILVFSQFIKMLQLIEKELNKEKIHYSYLDGSTKNRKEAIETFQQDNNCRVMLISLKAGSLGLNLTEADYVYLVDPWWNPAVEQQAIDRTHRIGQDKHVIAYKMICRDTVEEKILQLQNQKKSLADDLITAEENFVKNLNLEDIKAILE